MGGKLFGGPARTNISNDPATTLRVQTSLQGRPISIVYGQQRLAGNMVWYGDFIAKSSGGSGGKGGAVASVFGKGSGNYKYTAAGIISIADGPIAGILTVYNGNSIDFIVQPPQSILDDLAQLGIIPSYGDIYNTSFFDGTYPQAVWSWLESAYPSQAIPYPGEALACYQKVDLGSSPSFPNFNYEVLSDINSDVPALGPDANPINCIIDFLTNPDRGVQGFPSALVSVFPDLQNYCRAAGLMISPVMVNQQAATAPLSDWMKGLAADFFWSNGILQATPYADQPVSGNGYTFTPITTPVYNLDYDDFLTNQGTLGNNSDNTPVAITRKDPSTVLNKIQLEYLDRSNLYNPVTIYASDDATIVSTGRLRLSDLRSHHFFCLASAAASSAQLQLAREQITLQYQFTLGREFILLDPMDIVTLTSETQGLSLTPCRVIEIQENEDGTLTFTGEEYLGTVGPALYPRQQPLGTALNYNAPSGSINVPTFYEPPDQLAGGLVLNCYISGAITAQWGGCFVWVSQDGTTYTLMPGQIIGPARQGFLTSALPSVTAVVNGPTIDNTNTCAVTLAESDGTLGSGTVADMTSANTLCLVDQELIAYQTATLTGPNAYSLAPLLRGAYGTTIASHASGAPFVAIGALNAQTVNNGVYSYPYPANYVGTTLSFKFQSFNQYGGNPQQIEDVNPYTYTLTGAALTSPLPNVSNLVTVFSAGFLELYWDEIDDFRTPIRYLVKKGTSWVSALEVADVAHPPIVVYGNDTYWISAYFQSSVSAGLTVYSGTPQSIAIAGNTLAQNVIKTSNQQTEGWPGTFVNTAKIGTDPSAVVQLTAGIDVFAPPDIFSVPDVFAVAAGSSGTYEIASADWVNVGYVASCYCNVNWTGTGAQGNINILTVPNVLDLTDVLGSAASEYVKVYPQIATATTATLGVPNWSDWQNFVPGVYLAQWVKFRWVLETEVTEVVTYLLSASFEVQVSTRIDHYTGLSISSSGTTITFAPDGASTAPFNGGDNGAALPMISGFTPTTSGDSLLVTALSLSSVTIEIINAGSPVARTGVSFTATGY